MLHPVTWGRNLGSLSEITRDIWNFLKEDGEIFKKKNVAVNNFLSSEE